MTRPAAMRAVAILGAGLVLVLAGCGAARARQEQAALPLDASHAVSGTDQLPRPAAWEIEYVLSGGFAGLHRRLTLSSRGTMVAADLRTNVQIEQQASSELVAELGDLLAKTDLSGIPARRSVFPTPCADCFEHALTVVVDGREYRHHAGDLSLPDSPAASLVSRLSTLLQRALTSTGPGR